MNRRSKRNIAILRSQERSPRCSMYRLQRVLSALPAQGESVDVFTSPLLLAQENALTAQPFKPLV